MSASFPPTQTHATKEECRESFFLMQSMILQKQAAKEPFLIGRLSGNEPYLCSIYRNTTTAPPWLIQNMLFGAGIRFNNSNDLEEYVEEYTRSFDMCDQVGVWSGGPMYAQGHEFYKYIAPRLPKHCVPICAPCFEPFYYMKREQYAFDKIFENRKVLILSSHYNTIKGQLNKLDKLFAKPIFPASCEIYVHKSPQQNGGNHDEQSWREHFNNFKTEVRAIKNGVFDFDIALVSCGGFGMPICAFIRSELEKSAIYVGGALQLYFGIMGKRWDNSTEILKKINEHWTRPLDSDKPTNTNLCEGSCYW